MQTFNVFHKNSKYEVIIDDEDFERVTKYNWFGWTTPRHTSMYVVGWVDHKTVRLHRFIMGAKIGSIVDHSNGNALDNRKCNLRIATSKQNNQNAKKRRNSKTSKFKGVHYCNVWKIWKAQIQTNKKKLCLGSYNTELEAAKAYDLAALEYFGEFARINIK